MSFEEVSAGLDAIKKATQDAREATRAMLEDQMAVSSQIVSQQAAALVQGVLQRPDFFGGTP